MRRHCTSTIPHVATCLTTRSDGVSRLLWAKLIDVALSSEYVKLVHFTKQNSPDEPVQVAFAATDDQGKEEIITGEAPYSYDLFHLLRENGWRNIRRGVASIRESRAQRRAMSAWSPMLSQSAGTPIFIRIFNIRRVPALSFNGKAHDYVCENRRLKMIRRACECRLKRWEWHG
jgi:hypothetical protein